MTVLGRQRGFVARGTLIPGGGPLVGQEYFRILDQSGTVWYWWIAYSLAADWGIQPEKPFDQEVVSFATPSWLRIQDDEGQNWYVHPEVDGSPLVVINQPAGQGILSPALRVRGGKTRYRYHVVGGALDVDPV